jgi:hypothetical protein
MEELVALVRVVLGEMAGQVRALQVALKIQAQE